MAVKFNILEHPIAFQKPDRLTDVDCWHLHIPFAFTIIDMIQPKVLVELGTHKGDSYCSFCQAVSSLNLSTVCFAIDSWEGDKHAGFYGEEIFDELKRYHDQKYGSFSTLLKSFFDDAVEYFEDKTIDILHIDGHHSYASVKNDFERWMTKLSEKSVVLIHDTNVREREFGVWKLWIELKQKYPNFEFKYGSGLGVLATGHKIESEFHAFLNYAQKDDNLIENIFYGLGRNITLNRTLETNIREKDKKINDYLKWIKSLQEYNKNRDNKINDLEKWIHTLKDTVDKKSEAIDIKVDSINKKNKEIQYKNKEIQNVKKEKQSLQIINNKLKNQIYNYQKEIQHKEKLISEIFTSKGWKWLTRARRIKELVKFRSPTIKSFQNKYYSDTKTYKLKVINTKNSKRVKVVHAIANLHIGGSSRLIVDLIEHLGHKYNQKVISCEVPNPLAYDGFEFHSVSQNCSIEEIVRYLKKTKPKILHIHYWNHPWYQTVMDSTKHYPCKVIENINTPVAPLRSDSVDQYIAVSEYARNYMPPAPENASVIYPGSNFTIFQRNGAPISDDTIGMVYRLDHDKLNENSIQLFIRVVQKRKNTKVYIVGGGRYLETYKDQVKEAGLMDNFTFTDYVTYQDLPSYYKKFSLFVAPVHSESFGQVSPFAMSMGLPVAGYNIGALSEILGSEECLGESMEELTDIIIDLLNNRKKRIEIGQQNRARALKHFSVESMVAAYDRLYERMLKN